MTKAQEGKPPFPSQWPVFPFLTKSWLSRAVAHREGVGASEKHSGRAEHYPASPRPTFLPDSMCEFSCYLWGGNSQGLSIPILPPSQTILSFLSVPV